MLAESRRRRGQILASAEEDLRQPSGVRVRPSARCDAAALVRSVILGRGCSATFPLAFAVCRREEELRCLCAAVFAHWRISGRLSNTVLHGGSETQSECPHM